jgi:NADH-quinone oxidoreductase subunit B
MSAASAGVSVNLASRITSTLQLNRLFVISQEWQQLFETCRKRFDGLFVSSLYFIHAKMWPVFLLRLRNAILVFYYMSESQATSYDSKIEGNVIFTRLDAALNWVRKNSLWPMPMGLACCAIELMATAASRFDIARFGAEVMRFSPRQCDVMIVAGTVTYKMALAVKRIYEQMPEPKWVIAMGACASTGGMYRSYAVLQGIDQLLPVDVYISGCPPRPEALLAGLMKLQEKISGQPAFRDQNPSLAEKLEDTLA